MRIKKSQIWISAILYMLIAAVALTLVIQAGLPLLENMREKSTYSRTEDMLLSLDKVITDVGKEGEGSQRVVPIDMRAGELSIRNGQLIWEYETETRIFEPKTRVNLGNLMITTNADITSTEHADHYFMTNNYINVNITKIGTPGSWAAINTSTLMNYLEFKGNSKRTNGTFSFTIGDNATSRIGQGYTWIKDTGSNLPYATVVAHINSTPYEYDLELTLESDADFIRVNVKNLKLN